MTRDEYGEILSKLWTSRAYTKSAEDHIRCDRLLFNWLSLGVTVFGWVTRGAVFASKVFDFDEHVWRFTLDEKLYSYTEVVENGTWTPELVEKMEEQLIDINDLAAVLKVPAKTIRNKLSNGTWPIEPLRIGKALRWRESDVNAFIGAGAIADENVIPMGSRD